MDGSWAMVDSNKEDDDEDCEEERVGRAILLSCESSGDVSMESDPVDFEEDVDRLLLLC